VEDAEADADRQRHEALLRGAGELAEGLLNALGQCVRGRLLVGGRFPSLPSSSRRFLLVSLALFALATLPIGGDEAGGAPL